jgi:hypothetical protein
MLKKLKNKFKFYKESKLKITPGESVRDGIINSAVQAAYVAGNNTDKIADFAETAKTVVDGGTAIVGGSEASVSLGTIIFKAGKDIARKDVTCTSLCCVSATCESVALLCSTTSFIPFSGRVYIGAKIISKGCMRYRNLCAGEGC